MNKEQALKRDVDTKNYIEKNKLRALFSQLTRQVLLKRPQNPISYLIDYIEKRNKRSILCIQGYDEQKRTRLATSLANKFNFQLINLNAIFGGQQYHFRSNKQICDKVIQELSKVDKVFRGIVISGFPNNAYQADTIQKAGIIPQRYYLLYNDQPAVRQAYLKKHSEEETEVLMDRNALQLKQLKQILGDQADQLPLIPQKALEKLSSTTSIRLKKVTPLQAPRIVVMHPPYLVPKTLNTLIQKYSFHWISLQNSFTKASKKEEFAKYVGSHVRQHKSLSKEIQLALIETQSKTSAAKNKGILISGWPFRKQSMPFLKQHFINPHLIIIFTAFKQKAIQQFTKLDQNDSSLFSITDKPNLQNYKVQLKDYENLVEGLKGQTNCQLLSLTQSEQQVIKTFESLIQNPKIYS